MVTKLWLTLFYQFIIVISIICVASTQNNATLKIVHVLFRHGDKIQDKVSFFPKDIHINQSYAPFNYGDLTTRGKQKLYNLGKYLRTRYENFLPLQYNTNDVYSLSTNSRRTKMSLQLVLTGLFPPSTSDIFIDHQMWQPVSFDYEHGPGVINLPFLYCATFLFTYLNYQKTDDYQNNIVKRQDLYDELSEYTGVKIRSPSQLLHIYSILESQEAFGLKLPPWSKKFYPKALGKEVALEYYFVTANCHLKQYTAGNLLRKILQDTELKIKGELPEERKIFLYSAHEYNLGNMLSALNVLDPHVPPFGSAIIFEIHQINGDYGLKLFYHDYTTKEPKLLTIPGCSQFCKLERFYELVEDFLPIGPITCQPGEL